MRVAARIAAVGAMAIGLALAAGRTADAGTTCPARSVSDPERAARLSSLGRPSPGASLAVCFATSSVESGGVLVDGATPFALLPASAPDAHLAGRLAHLSLHVDRPPFVLAPEGDGAGCVHALVRAAVREAEAALLEAQVRRRLGAEPDPQALANGVSALRGYAARCLVD